MENQENINLAAVDFEDMDDLALPDHIDWDHSLSESFTLEALDSVEW